MNFLEKNEFKTNILTIKMLWGVFFGGFSMLLISKFTGMSVTPISTILITMAIVFVIFIATTAVWYFNKGAPFVKYMLMTVVTVASTLIIFLIGKAVFLAPLWAVIIIAGISYYNLNIIVFGGISIFILNLFLILTLPGPGLEEAGFRDLVGNPLTLLLAIGIAAAVVVNGRNFINIIIDAEKKSSDLKNHSEEIVISAKKASTGFSEASENLFVSTESINASVEEIASTTNEFAASVQELAQRAAEMAESSREVKEKAV